MAQHSKISSLTDELVRSIVGFDPVANRQAYKHAKDIASRGLRGHQFARTNQFEVASTFSGLDEKFRVKNRDDLADALQMRLQKLEALTSRFKPDFLSLLLHLTDRPLENTKVEALELLRPPSPQVPLTWDEILEEDPYTDEDIWKDIDYAVESSSDEQIPKKRAQAKASSATSVDEDDMPDPATCIVPIEEGLSQTIEKGQFWTGGFNQDQPHAYVTELQAIRETLFMLAGLETTLYQRDSQQKTIRINPHYSLRHARAETVKHILLEFIQVGTDVYRLRGWAKQSSTLPLIQTFEAAVGTRLTTFDLTLAELQQQYLTPSTPVAVSLLQLHADVHSSSVSLLHLAYIVLNIGPQLSLSPFSHLEALFEHVTLAQMTLETGKFIYLSSLFFDCLQTYLKPIRKWMEAGELGSNDETFFVFEGDSGSDATSLWHDRYVLRFDAHNALRSPSFLQPAAKKIFNTGKSVVFLKELGTRNADIEQSDHEPRLDHATVCGVSEEVPLSPFPELFQIAFDGWMQSKYSQASAVLRHHLVENCGLTRSLVALETLYLGKNGAVFEDFANALFERMDLGRKGWNDRYVLTEITRGIFSATMPPSIAEKIVARSSKAKNRNKSVEALATVTLDFALSWPIQNVIQRRSIIVYQQISTFLLQSYRVKYLLLSVRPIRNIQIKSLMTQMTQKLRHHLTWFVDTLRSYLTETAIYFTTQEMYHGMEKAEDIDEMALVHLKYVTKMQERALLSNDLKPIHKAIVEILDLGVLFAKTVTNGDTMNLKRTRTKHVKSMWKHDGPDSIVTELSQLDSDEESDEIHPEDRPFGVMDHGAHPSALASLRFIDKELTRLLQFVMAGLRSVGRAGAEPMWEQLAERLDWKDKKLRP
jgi:gamma-tubulin complex component 5